MSGPGAPAPAGGGAGPTSVKTILEFAADPSHDRAEGHIDLSDFEVDPNNSGASPSPAVLCANLSDEVRDGVLVHLGLIDEGGYLHEYFLPTVLKLRTGQTSSRDGKLVANIGDFDEDGMFYSCTIDKRKHLGLVASSVTCCTADTLSAAAQADTGNTRKRQTYPCPGPWIDKRRR